MNMRPLRSVPAAPLAGLLSRLFGLIAVWTGLGLMYTGLNASPRFFYYFTNLGNLALGVFLAADLVRRGLSLRGGAQLGRSGLAPGASSAPNPAPGPAPGSQTPSLVHGALTVYLGLIGLVYTVLLQDTWRPEGGLWWANLLLHFAVPAWVWLDWALFAPRRPWPLWAPFAWLGGPALYLGWVLLHQPLVGDWPYPFLDWEALGPAAWFASVAGVAAATLVLGFGLRGLSLWRAGRHRRARGAAPKA